jgi:glyoxylate/hydroxypyruvate/2-ketogluconate reductase
MKKPSVLIARANFPEIVTRLSEHFDVESNQADVMWTKAEMIASA